MFSVSLSVHFYFCKNELPLAASFPSKHFQFSTATTTGPGEYLDSADAGAVRGYLGATINSGISNVCYQVVCYSDTGDGLLCKRFTPDSNDILSSKTTAWFFRARKGTGVVCEAVSLNESGQPGLSFANNRYWECPNPLNPTNIRCATH